MPSLRRRLLLLAAGLVAVLLALALYAAGRVRADHERAAAARGAALAHALASQLDLWLEQPARGLQRLAEELATSSEPQPHLLADALSYHALFTGLQLVDAGDRLRACAPPRESLIGLDWSAQPWVRTARSASGVQWSAVQRQTDGGLSAALSLRAGDGLVLGAQVDLGRMSAVVATAHRDQHGFVAVVDRQGTVLAHSDAAESARAAGLRHLLGGGPGEWLGRPGLAGVAPVAATGWSVVVFQDRAAVFADVDRLRLLLIAALGLAGLLVGLLLWYASDRLLRPVADLARQAARLATGQRAEAVRAGYREFVPAARAFDSMAAAVAAREDDLRRSRAEYRELVESAGAAILRLDRTGAIRFANGHAARLAGGEPAALVGRPLAGSLLPQERGPLLASLLADPAGFAHLECEVVAHDGRRQAVSWSLRSLTGADGTADGLLAVGSDVSEQRRGEAAIRTLLRSAAAVTGDEFFATTASILHPWAEADLVVLWELDGQGARPLASHGEGGPPPGSCHPLDGSPCGQAARDGFVHLAEGAAMRFPDLPHLAGGPVHGYAGIAARGRDGAVVGLVCLYAKGPLPLPHLGREVLEIVASRVAAEIARRGAESRLRQVEKMDAIGQLAGGIAHDFNNQLGGILGHCELLLRHDLDADGRRHTLAIQTAAQRSAQLTGQLLAFSRQGNYRMGAVDLDLVVDEVAALLERSLDKAIVIERRRPAVPAIAEGDAGMLSNAVLNLALNARDAMPHGGRLVFAVGASGGDGMVELEVTDTGTGMTPEVQARIFEPFFTTKGQGHGTGLGLPAVYGTITAHHGTIAVESAPGRGTTFRLRLPTARSAPAPAAAPAIAADRRPLQVLLVEDEPLLRELAAEMLADLGHRATACADGLEAEAALRASPGAYDVVLLDLVMPRRGGPETFAALRALEPDLRVVVTSGYSADGAPGALLAQGARGLLAKPYSLGQLDQALAGATAQR